MTGRPKIATPVTIRGERFADAAAAAAAFGVTRAHILTAIRLGKLDKVGRGVDRDAAPIRIRGKLYKNARAAGKAFGLSPGAIWKAVEQGRIDRVGLPREGSPQARPFEIFGMRWPSRAAASRALGFGPAYIGLALNRQSAGMLARIRDAALAEGMRRNARAAQARLRQAARESGEHHGRAA